MTMYNITPRRGSSGWKVEANGRRTSTHRKQQTAINAAQRRADSGDMLIIHNSDGQVRDRRRVR